MNFLCTSNQIITLKILTIQGMFGAPKEKNTQFITNTKVLIKINMNSASLSLAADIDLSFFFPPQQIPKAVHME